MRKQRKARQEWPEKATRIVRGAAQAGLRLNQMSSDWLRLVMRQAEATRNWQRGFSRLCSAGVEAMMVSQRQGNDTLELMGHSTRAKLRLMRQALAAVQESNVFGSQAKWTLFWTNMLGLAQSNAAAMTRIQSRALDSWLRLVGNHGEG